MVKVVAKCAYCNDPIYDYQETAMEKGRRYHKGCLNIKQKEDKQSVEVP